jgi:hypothetical protein
MITRYTQTEDWCDVIALPNGTFACVTCASGSQTVSCYIEDGATTTLCWSLTAAQPLLFLRAVTLASGETLVIGKGNTDGAALCYIVSPAGVVTVVPLGVITSGNYSVAVEASQSRFYVAATTDVDEWRDWYVSPNGIVTAIGTHAVPIWTGGTGTTSQGFLAIVNKVVIWTDESRYEVLGDGRTLVVPDHDGETVLFGQDALSGGYWTRDRFASALILPGVVYEPHVVSTQTAAATATFVQPPIRHPVVDQNGMATRPWVVWFQSLAASASASDATMKYAVCGRGDSGCQWAIIAPPYPDTTIPVSTIIQRGTRLAQPVASSVAIGTLYNVTDETLVERSNGTTWDVFG